MTTENSQLDVLLKQAETIDGDAAAQTPAGMQQQQELAEQASLGEQNVQAVAAIIEIALPILGTMWPSLKRVWTDDNQKAVAGTLGPVLTKHGISLKDWGAAYAEELAALAVCGPLAWASVAAVKADTAARTEQPKAPEKGIELHVPVRVPQEAGPVVLG